MQPDTFSQQRIEVNMLGEFSITINGHQLTNLKGRTKRVWMLIEYLLANRHKDISTDKLIEILWPEDECKDPLNALKNLVYRARELLKELSRNSRAEYIQYIRNTYSWNNSYPCLIDTEQLVEFMKQGADEAKDIQSRILAYKNALALYRGEFLPKSAYSNWVISMSAYYANLYNECVLRTCRLLIDERRFEEVIEICETALTHAPLEESIHKMLLYGYLSTGRRNQALDHYNYVIDLFYKELGVDISESMRSLYKQLINSINNIELDLSVIKNDLKEAAEINGAYYCDYEAFKSVYRIQARTVARTGNSVYIVLFTLNDLEGGVPKPRIAKLAAERLKMTIMESLRKGDVVAAYSNTQFIVMLPLINYENAEIVTDRILQRFRFRYRRENIKITTRINALDSQQ
ncbi:BTAD domain-containing putative transcriptional regulator [Caproiciproducens galactitolivorans]|uniref:BTAD domain-containing putative transcriptional regulator n=1 Tax=Caproiciproducens galactitolivorans TaxID=642589 RepID=A0ABT4BUT6_9FIRM|nr:BTAD domain-containing putative transcriptional regulator [Caproiciproducens galactitolivorans]MCY1714661.1 BTAD domain-containing putative transcriptional regulator [Caproiciproducens galactitolivorans]